MIRINFLILFLIISSIPFIQAQELMDPNQKPDVLKFLEDTQTETFEEFENKGKPQKQSNFDKWAFSEKKHAIVFYYAPLFHYGANTDSSAYTLNHDFGLFYRWFMVDKEKYKLNLQVLLEQNSLLAGESTPHMSKTLNMISVANASDEENHSISLDHFYFENFFFNGKLDFTLGKFDPLFFSTFTPYGYWDRYVFFSKTMASNPIPPIDPGMGFYLEYHISKRMSIAGQMVDNNAPNDFLYLGNIFNTTWMYQGIFRFNIPTKKNLFSDHILSYYYTQEIDNENPSGRGFIYVGNQELVKNTILILKASSGTGKILKLNSAYAIGLLFKNPLERPGDRFGASVQLNEKDSKYEWGVDTYWKFFIREWISISPNLQVYYSINDQLVWIPGFRAFLGYTF